METTNRHVMEKLFNPSSVVVAGASGNPRNMGSRNLRFIRDFGFAGRLWAVNPRGEACHGAPGYRQIPDIPGPIDLCFIAVPASGVAQVVADCARKGVPFAQILTSGFGETGSAGQASEQAVLKAADGKTRLVGPNCLGIYAPSGRLTFVASPACPAGTASIASQSGGLSIDMILQAKTRGLSLGKLVSMGNCLDLDPVDFLEFFGTDPDSEVIGLYLEGIKRGRSFFEALKKIARRKPVVILKGGRTRLGAKSAASHTNALAGEYATWRAAVFQAGAVCVETVDEFLSVLTGLQGFVPRPRGRSIALVGNGGGATVLATDLLSERGLTLATLSSQTQEAVSRIRMPPGSTVGNPTDTPVNALDKGGGGALGAVIDCFLKDPAVDGIVIHFNLLPFVNYENRKEIASGISEALLAITEREKPVYIGLRAVPDPAIEEVRFQILASAVEARFPCFLSASEAVQAMADTFQWAGRNAAQPPEEAAADFAEAFEAARKIIRRERELGIKSLSQEASFRILDLFGIPHPALFMAKTASQAASAAIKMGFPVVMKIDSPDILHKTEAGGVRLGLNSAAEASEAFDEIYRAARRYCPNACINGILVQACMPQPVQEMICGLKQDPVFGPVMILGLGGIFVELLKDVSIRLLPASAEDLRRMWREIAGASLLTGYRGQARADTAALENLLERVAVLGAGLPEIREMDLNPVMLMEEGDGLSVVDCRIILDP